MDLPFILYRYNPILLLTMKAFSLFLFLLISSLFLSAQSTISEHIRLNQLGFYPQGPKSAFIIDANATKFYIIKSDKKDTVYKGVLTNPAAWEYSGEKTLKADFSAFTIPGNYILFVPSVGRSYAFEIKNSVHHKMGKAALKTFYYQRASIDLKPKFAGKYSRKAGHPDTFVVIHGSAKTNSRPEGSHISSSRGWYDAGDYNKYIVNSGISTYTLLAAYEHFPAYFDTLALNIPESKNKVADILDESLWNLRWMLTMQDEDGGVYHKLTNPGFDGFVMPEMATKPRYVVVKTTTASFDFAAVMAQSSRIFSRFKKELPGLSDSCLKASIKAYDWAKKNKVLYNQNEISQAFKPSIHTGAYDDNDFSDEYQWAAMELFASTGKPEYYKDANIQLSLNNGFGVPTWQKVNSLGLFSLVHLRDKIAAEDGKAMQEALVKLADKLKNYAQKESAYGVPMGQSPGDFVWGSNSTAANQGIILIQAYNLTKDKSYLDAAIASLDYILGRNGTGFSYVTGFGEKSTMHPHHRPSEADGIAEPIPGFLAGGPNPSQQDQKDCPGVEYPSDKPGTSYLDHVCSYASNEIAINWNAPLVYLTLAIEAVKANDK
jgi:endoglucanase